MEFNKYTISKKGWLRKTFEIKQDDEVIYTIQSKGWTAFKRMIFTNTDGEEVLVIHRPFTFTKFTFNFLENSQKTGEFTKATFSNNYTLESDYATYTADGNWLGNEYTVYLGDEDIAKVSRKMFSHKNQYGIAIMEGNHDLFILAMVIIIEAIKIIRKNRGN